MGDYYYHVHRLEMDLVGFYHEIFLEEFRWADWTRSILCVETVRRAYCKYTLENALTCVSFEDAGMRCAYIFLNTPCFSSAVAFHFWNLVKTNPAILKDVRGRGTLNICCLGGGPATEVVAIVKALELILELFCTPAKPLRIHATVVDIDPGWAQTLKKVTQSWWKRINPAILKLKLSFVQADLTEQPLREEVVGALRRAELVTMVKFVSAVHGTRGREKIAEMLKEITSHIADQGVLFFMNASRFSCMTDVTQSICSSGDMMPIYGPVFYDDYYLSEPSQSVCFGHYFKFYGLIPPQIQCKNHVAAWRKSTSRFHGSRLLEIGSGAFVHNVAAASAHFPNIVMSDYVEDNCEELKRWLQGTSTILQLLDVPAELEGLSGDLEVGKKLLESRIKKSVQQVVRCDVLNDNIFLEEVKPDVAPPYDVIISSLCLEAAAPDFESFILSLKRINKLLRTGGGLILVGFFQGKRWTVEQNDYHYIQIDEVDIRKALKESGFGNVDMKIREKLDVEYEHDQYYCLAAEKLE